MTKEQLKSLKEGRPGSNVLVKGTVRTLGTEGVEVQFATYSVWIPLRDIILPKTKVKK